METDILKLESNPIGSTELTKGTAKELTRRLVQNVMEGWNDPLDILVKLTWFETAVADALKEIRAAAVDEAAKYGASAFDFGGATLQVCETGVKYDYSHDKEWRELNEQMAAMKLEQKQLEERLRFCGGVPKTSTTSVKVTLRK